MWVVAAARLEHLLLARVSMCFQRCHTLDRKLLAVVEAAVGFVAGHRSFEPNQTLSEDHRHR